MKTDERLKTNTSEGWVYFPRFGFRAAVSHLVLFTTARSANVKRLGTKHIHSEIKRPQNFPSESEHETNPMFNMKQRRWSMRSQPESLRSTLQKDLFTDEGDMKSLHTPVKISVRALLLNRFISAV